MFGILVDPANPGNQSVIADLQAGARALGLELIVANARTESDLEPAFATFSQQRVGAVLVGLSTLLTTERIAGNSRRWRPAMRAPPVGIFPYREYALAGGLMSYGSSLGYFYHENGIYTGQNFTKATSQPICQCNKRQKSSLSLTSRPPRRSALPSRKRCWQPRTR